MLGFLIGQALGLANTKRLADKLAANRPGWFHLRCSRSGEHHWTGPFPARDAVESWAAANPVARDVVTSIEYCVNRDDAVRRATALLDRFSAAKINAARKSSAEIRCFKCKAPLRVNQGFCDKCGTNVTLVTNV
jgi:hypothetical protein